MKILYSFIFLLIMIILPGCKKDDLKPQLQSCQNTGTVENTHTGKNGRIYKVAEFWVIDLVVNGDVIRCSPCNLPTELKIENKNIVLNANFHSIPPNVKMAGQPMEITKIY